MGPGMAPLLFSITRPRTIRSTCDRLSPCVALGPGILFLLNDIGDDRAKDGRELERMPGITRGDDEAFEVLVVRDPEGSVKGVAVKADAV